MAINEDKAQFILDQLQGWGPIESKRMFGGMGFFREGKMFAKMGGDTFRFKVDEHNQADYEAAGMKPYFSEKKGKGMPYWEVPVSIQEDADQLKAWADKAYEAAVRAKK